MRIAYLLLCHKNEEQVETLIDQLSSDNVDFYIHIDKKSCCFLLQERSNVFILPQKDRVDIRWATYSMIRAELNLIGFVLKSQRQYDYIGLLSGQDFPVKTNQFIEDFLTKNMGEEFIEVIDHSDIRFHRYLKRTNVYYPEFLQKRSSVSKIARKIYMILTGYPSTAKVFSRSNPMDFEFEFGSQWWLLSYDCIKWIDCFLRQHREYCLYFSHAMTPDECFFQTLLVASPFNQQIRDRVTYLEWNDDQNHPKSIDKNVVDQLINSERYLFCRKIDDIEIAKEIVQILKRKQ